MKLVDVKKELLNKTFESLKKQGFKKRKNLITLIEGDYMIYIGFGIVDSDTSFPSTFHYGIASKHLNYIKSKIFSDSKFRKNDFTTIYGQKQTILFEKGQYPVLEYKIQNLLDVELMVSNVTKYFVEDILPNLKQLQSLEKLSLLMNSKEIFEHSMHLPTSISNAIILSRLTGKPEYEKIKQQYLNLSKDWPEWDKQNFQKVIRFLDDYSPEELLK